MITKHRKGFLLFWLALMLLMMVAPGYAQDSDLFVYTTAQRFQHGLMLWRSDTGHIWVLVEDGRVFDFPSSKYAGLPDNPIFGDPPSRLRPIFGFGKVWGNHYYVRHALGWPSTVELGFDMRITQKGATRYLKQQNGIIYQINPNNTWEFATSLPDPEPRVLSFNVTPDPALPGETVTLSWSVVGTEMALIEFWSEQNGQPHTHIQNLENLATSGTTSLTIPADFTGQARFILWAANRVNDDSATMYQRIASMIVTINTTSGMVDFTTRGAYQNYQTGFMVWREDSGAVLVFSGKTGGAWLNYPQVVYQNWPDYGGFPAVAPNCIEPVNAFGKVWTNRSYVSNLVGCPVGTEESYTINGRYDSIQTMPQFISLPDGREIRLDNGAWTPVTQ